MTPNILLIGPRACGKTSIGRLLAAHLSRPFVDLDDRVRAAFDEPSVQQIWATHGEAGWRKQEVIALRRALEETGQVIALGGGVPCIEEARAMIEAARSGASARVVYLRAPVGELMRRLREEAGDRPSLTGGSAIEEVPEVVARREPMYCATADEVLDVASRSPGAVVDMIAVALSQHDTRGDDSPPSAVCS